MTESIEEARQRLVGKVVRGNMIDSMYPSGEVGICIEVNEWPTAGMWGIGNRYGEVVLRMRNSDRAGRIYSMFDWEVADA